MKTDIWIPIYINDYMADTMELEAEGHGIYLLLMFHYWKKENLPNDIDKLSRISRTRNKELLQEILIEYFTLSDSGYFQKRLCEEKEKANNNREAAKINGMKGGRPKKETQKKPIGYQNKTHGLSETEPSAKANHNPEKTSSSSSSSKPKKSEFKEKNLKKENLENDEEIFNSLLPNPNTFQEYQPAEQKASEQYDIDGLMKLWNDSGLPNCGMPFNLPNLRPVKDAIQGYGQEYIKETIINLSENKEKIGSKYIPSFYSLLANGKMGIWHDWKEDEEIKPFNFADLTEKQRHHSTLFGISKNRDPETIEEMEEFMKTEEAQQLAKRHRVEL